MQKSLAEQLHSAHKTLCSIYALRDPNVHIANTYNDTCVSLDIPRHRFRCVAKSDTHVYVALFCDFPGKFITQKNAFRHDHVDDELVCSAPTVRSIGWATSCASREYGALLGRGTRKLVLFILVQYGTAESTLKSNVRDFVDTLSEVDTDTLSVEVWHLDELQYNIFDNTHVVRHRIMTSDERVALAKRYRLRASRAFNELPCIERDDPACKWLGARCGDVVCAHHVDTQRGPEPFPCIVVK